MYQITFSLQWSILLEDREYRVLSLIKIAHGPPSTLEPMINIAEQIKNHHCTYIL